MNKMISELMSKNVITIDGTTTMDQVGQIFKENDIHHIPVVDKNSRLLGILSVSDYKTSLDMMTPFNNPRTQELNERSSATLIAKDYMTPNPVCVKENDPITKAVDIFKENKFHCLPVVDQERKIRGILSTYDLLLELNRKLTSSI